MLVVDRWRPALSAPARTVLLGADGTIGGLVRGLAAARDRPVHPASDLGPVVPGSVVIAAVPEPALLTIADRCLEVGAHLIAPGADPQVLGELVERAAATAAARVTVAPSQGWDPAVADLLVARAAEGLEGPLEVHVAYALPGARLRARSPGERDRLRRLLGEPFEVMVDGRVVEERDGEARRLAWYPRPVGPRHAAGVPGPVVHTVPRHVRGVRTIRSYRAMSTAAAESRQLVANLARTAPGAALAGAVVGRGAHRVATAEQRWACVVEVADERTVSRAWAHGTDHLGLTATTLLDAVERLSGTSEVPVGLLAPAQLGPADDQLDALAARTSLRWGRAHSERPGR